MFLQLRSLSSPLKNWSRSSRRTFLDFFLIFGAAAVLRVMTYDMELFEQLHDYSRSHEEWELDELIVSLAIASLAFIVFGIRRMQDQRRELRLRLAAEQHAMMLALQDPLTGLPNRRRFLEALSAQVGRSGQHAVIILDLDGFKPVNDVFGHASGDEALRTIAQRLKSLGDERITSARLGGDEFALILRNLSSPSEATRIAERVVAAIEIPISAAGTEHHLEASLGIAPIDGTSTVPEEYVRRADVALYRAKEDYGASSYVVYDEAMDTERSETVRLERDLRKALAAGEIVPHYQPIVDLRTGDILKFEALARWRDPQRGDVPPAVFIPVAERRGLISEITETMLRQACGDAVSWPPSVTLSVNLSAVLLQDKSFSLRLVRILNETGFPAHRLELEITERALKAEYDMVRPFLDNLRSLGVRIALDDFGTGYSSLSRLRALPFDNIKIDRSFVQGLPMSGDRTQFVRTILQLGRGLGMTVTAEGVEDRDELQALIAEGCVQGQGFLFSEAVPAEQVSGLLEARRAAQSA